LEIFARIISSLTKDNTLAEAVALASRLPRNLSEAPYVGLMWEPNTATISNSHKVTLREILLYMLDSSKYSDSKLLERYRRETGDDNISLPGKLV
jgi:DNA sulfur modification protein DndB